MVRLDGAGRKRRTKRLQSDRVNRRPRLSTVCYVDYGPFHPTTCLPAGVNLAALISP